MKEEALEHIIRASKLVTFTSTAVTALCQVYINVNMMMDQGKINETLSKKLSD